jgi:hypothetical protein
MDPDPQPWIKAHKIVLGLASEVFSHSVQRKICRDHGLYGHKPRSFPPNRAPKMPESPQLFFGLWLVSRIFKEFQHAAIQTKIVQPFGGFFQQIQSALANGKKGFYTNRDPNKQEVGFIFV